MALAKTNNRTTQTDIDHQNATDYLNNIRSTTLALYKIVIKMEI